MRPAHVSKVIETSIYTTDLERSESFYTNILGLELVARQQGRHVFLKAGKTMLLIFNLQTTLSETNVPHGATGPIHFALEIDPSDYDNWKNILSQHSVPIEKEVTWPTGSRSIYFRDPDNNAVELITRGNWPLID